MWIVFLLLPLSVLAEDLGELSANPAGLSGSFGFFGFPISQPNERDKPNKPDKPVLVSVNKTDQIDQINEIEQFRFSVLAGLDPQSLRRRESLQPQQSHESLRSRPADRRTIGSLPVW